MYGLSSNSEISPRSGMYGPSPSHSISPEPGMYGPPSSRAISTGPGMYGPPASCVIPPGPGMYGPSSTRAISPGPGMYGPSSSHAISTRSGMYGPPSSRVISPRPGMYGPPSSRVISSGSGMYGPSSSRAISPGSGVYGPPSSCTISTGPGMYGPSPSRAISPGSDQVCKGPSPSRAKYLLDPGMYGPPSSRAISTGSGMYGSPSSRPGMNIDAKTRDKGQTALLIACFYGSRKTADILLSEKYNCQIDIRDSDGNNALHLCLSGPPQVMEITEIQRPNLRENDKQIKQQLYLAELLVNKGVSYTVKNNNGKLPQELPSEEKFKQEFTAIIVLSLSITSMIDHLKWKSLETLRNINGVTMMYKITPKFIAVDLNLYLSPQPVKNTRFTSSLQYQTFSTRTDYFKYSFFLFTVVLWNSLPQNIISIN
ncbi:unnamed protein product [Mytilus coruscus]|uniref:Uncharacterized protein n=1 Tax=Mytilus coruscus TaxID=42192 RepID=A0A6J8BE41_MYTCO|nr:unnamed protein product [Mytilus coruscus]